MAYASIHTQRSPGNNKKSDAKNIFSAEYDMIVQEDQCHHDHMSSSFIRKMNKQGIIIVLVFTTGLVVGALVAMLVNMQQKQTNFLDTVSSLNNTNLQIHATDVITKNKRAILLSGHLRQWNRTKGYWRAFCEDSSADLWFATVSFSTEKSGISNSIDFDSVENDVPNCNPRFLVFDKDKLISSRMKMTEELLQMRLLSNPVFHQHAYKYGGWSVKPLRAPNASVDESIMRGYRRHYMQHAMRAIWFETMHLKSLEYEELVIGRSDILIHRRSDNLTYDYDDAVLCPLREVEVKSAECLFWTQYKSFSHNIFEMMPGGKYALVPTRNMCINDYFCVGKYHTLANLTEVPLKYATWPVGHKYRNDKNWITAERIVGTVASASKIPGVRSDLKSGFNIVGHIFREENHCVWKGSPKVCSA